MGVRSGETAGRAAKMADLSVLTPPLLTSLTGMRQALHALEAGSAEVKRVLLNEANLLYECRVCFNMFRSLANLVSHKTRFCRHRYAEVRHEFADKNGSPPPGGEGGGGGKQEVTVMIEPEAVAECCNTDPTAWDLSTYSPSMELIRTAGILQELGANGVAERPLVDRLYPKPRRQRNLSEILPQLAGRKPAPRPVTGLTVRLEPVLNTKNALYQSWRLTDAEGTLLPSVKDLNMTLQRIVIADDHTVVGPDGQAFVKTAADDAARTNNSSQPTVPPTGAQENSGGGNSSSTARPADETATKKPRLRLCCLICQASGKNWFWFNVKRHLITKHGLDADQAQSKRAEVFAKSAALQLAESQRPTALDNRNPTAATTFKPVKAVRVDVKKISLPNMAGPCLVVGPLARAPKACPVLAARAAVLVETSEAAAAKTNGGVLAVGGKQQQQKEEEEGLADEEPDVIPEDVERIIMENINRRKVQCNICRRKFSRTHLAQQHVAGTHLGLERWRCSVCHFGAWKRGHVLRHVLESHRQRNLQGSVSEVPKEVYFSHYVNGDKSAALESPSKFASVTAAAAGSEKPHHGVKTLGDSSRLGKLLLQHNLTDFNGVDSDNCSNVSELSDASTSGGRRGSDESLQMFKHHNGDSGVDLMPAGALAEIKSQLRGQVGHHRDSDDEISFKLSPKSKRHFPSSQEGELSKNSRSPETGKRASNTSPGSGAKVVSGGNAAVSPSRPPGGRKRLASESNRNSTEMPRNKIAHV